MPYKDKELGVRMMRIRSKKHHDLKKEDEDYMRRRKKTQWKHYGFKGDLDEVFDIYMRSEQCYDCSVKMETGKRGKTCKTADHHHSSGYFRHIVCCSCNNKRMRIDKYHQCVLIELHRVFLR